MAVRGARHRLSVIADSLRSQLWPLPALAVVLALALGVLLPEVDAAIDEDLPDGIRRYLFGGGPESARTVLGAIGSSLVTLTSLTFSLTVVTLQLASGQFSPRLLRTFGSDRFVHVTLSLFLATFVFALTVLRTVRTAASEQDEFVPQISVTLAFTLAIASVLGLVFFLAHLAREIRVETMLARVNAEGSATAARVGTEQDGDGSRVRLPETPPYAAPLLAPATGFLGAVDRASLLRAAVEQQAVIVIEQPPGSWLVAGTPLGWAWADTGAVPDAALEKLHQCLAPSLSTDNEPTSAQDVSFAITQITDVAAKALSPGVNDPRTAIHALGHSASLLRAFSLLQLGPLAVRDDEEGVDRVFLQRHDVGDLLDLAVSGPRRYGAPDPDVLARLYTLLAEVVWGTTDDELRDAVLGQLQRLDATAQAQEFDEAERARLRQLRKRVLAAADGTYLGPARSISP